MTAKKTGDLFYLHFVFLKFIELRNSHSTFLRTRDGAYRNSVVLISNSEDL